MRVSGQGHEGQERSYEQRCSAPGRRGRHTGTGLAHSGGPVRSVDCDGFSAHFSGHDHGRVLTWFDADGNAVRQQGKIAAVETDTNDRTGATVVVRTRINVHVDFLADRQTITGMRNLSTQHGRGVVIQSVGRVLSAADGTLLDFSGPADDILRGGGFCEALSG